jgi:peptide/nickel transport system substrate-binding protein
MLRKCSWLFLSMLMAASVALSSCAPQAAAPTSAPASVQATAVPTIAPEPTTPPVPKEATMSLTSNPESMNPLYASTWYTECVLDLILLPLWNIDDKGQYQMELAQELPTLENGGVSSDGLTITVKFRPEANWSDGTPVTADDAVFTYDMTMADGNGVFSRYPYDTYVESMTAVDPKTLEIKLSSPYVDWSTSFFTGISRVLPKHVLQPVFDAEATLDNAEWNRTANVVNGPFTLTEFVSDDHLTLAANEGYWRGRPKLDTLYIRIFADDASQLAALQSGQSDIGSYITGSQLPALKESGQFEMPTSPNGYIVTIFMNTDPKTAHPAMTDAKVRRALAMAIDRQLIIDQIYNGIYTIPATYWDDTVYDNPDLKPYPFDPEGAKALLDEAGWKVGANGVREKDGKKLELRYVYISGTDTTDTMVVTFQQMLADVGVKLNIVQNTEEVLWASYGDNGELARGNYDLTQWSDGMWYFPSPSTSYFLCSEIPTADYPTGYNWFGICDPQLDELFTAADVELDPAKRIADYHEIGKLMYDQTYIIPIRSDPDIWAVNTRLKDITFSGVDPLMFAYQWDVK